MKLLFIIGFLGGVGLWGDLGSGLGSTCWHVLKMERLGAIAPEPPPVGTMAYRSGSCEAGRAKTIGVPFDPHMQCASGTATHACMAHSSDAACFTVSDNTR